MIQTITRYARRLRGKPEYPQIFNPEVKEPISNPHDYPTNENGTPLVPEDDIVGSSVAHAFSHAALTTLVAELSLYGHAFRAITLDPVICSHTKWTLVGTESTKLLNANAGHVVDTVSMHATLATLPLYKANKPSILETSGSSRLH